jgi:hypothetical protein
MNHAHVPEASSPFISQFAKYVPPQAAKQKGARQIQTNVNKMRGLML